MPKITFNRPASVCFNKKIPGMLPATTKAVSGSQIFQFNDFRSFQTKIILLGYPNTTSNGEILILFAV